MLTQAWPLTGRFAEIEQFEAALADPSCHGVVIDGEAGVGKTRLADEFVAVAEDRGHSVWRAVASQTAAAVPLGALAHLIPRAGSGTANADPVVVFGRVADAIAEVASDSRVVVLIDELHHLDGTSLTLVHQLLAADLAFLVGTVRSDVQLADGIEVMWRSERVRRVALGTLPREGVDTLLHLALGGPLDGIAATELWSTSGGNVLFLRELILGAHERDQLIVTDGVWRLRSGLEPTRRLTQLIEDRVAGTDGATRDALDLLALCAPVGFDELLELAGPAVVDDLEAMGMIDVTTDRRRRVATLGHPLYGEVLRAAMTSVASSAILEAHADRVEAYGLRRREDALRVAGWRLDATGRADRDLLLRAARLARFAHDFDQVGRLADAAWTDGPDAESGLLLGEALYEIGRFAEAESILEQAYALARAGEAAGADMAHQIAHKRATNLFWGCLDPGKAAEVAESARAEAASTSARNELLAAEASILMYSGRPTDSLELLGALEPDADNVRARTVRAIPEAPALAVTGRTAVAIEVAHDGFADHLSLGDQLAIAHPGTHVVSEVFALIEAGRLDQAIELASGGYEVALADRVPIARIWFALNLGRAHLLAGRPVTAERWMGEAAGLARSTGFTGPLRMALNGIASAAATTGDAERAGAAVAELDAIEVDFGFLEPELALGRAWSRAVAGDPQAARDLLTEGAGAAEASGHLTSEAWLLHDRARLGEPAEVADRLDELAGVSDSELVAIRALHVRGLANEDPGLLTDAADRFESLGAWLLAAEAATRGGEAFRRRRQQRDGAALGLRGQRMAERCEGARTPALVASESVVPLSPREREICLLAADGGTSKDIAARLYLSARTVNNHLQAAYTKLGISRREELAQALNLQGTDDE